MKQARKLHWPPTIKQRLSYYLQHFSPVLTKGHRRCWVKIWCLVWYGLFFLIVVVKGGAFRKGRKFLKVKMVEKIKFSFINLLHKNFWLFCFFWQIGLFSIIFCLQIRKGQRYYWNWSKISWIWPEKVPLFIFFHIPLDWYFIFDDFWCTFFFFDDFPCFSFQQFLKQFFFVVNVKVTSTELE